MPLKVVTIPGDKVPVQAVTLETVREWARKTDSPKANRSVAVTIPKLAIDQRGLHYRQRPTRAGVDFSFEKGTLTLRLSQTIYLGKELSECARGLWKKHEDGHAADNNQALTQMDGKIRADPTLQSIFIGQQWFPKQSFNLVQSTITQVVGALFRALTIEAAGKRDVRAEYARVNRAILAECPEPLYHIVETGDSLPDLADFYYGDKEKARVIVERNREVIGDGQKSLVAGQRLLIPKP